MKTDVVPIIVVPDPHLRRVARPVPTVSPKLLALLHTLSVTLKQTHHPKGVGLAAPQIDHDWRIFATQLDNTIELFINPVIVTHSREQVLGEQEQEPDLEGCLSIPKLYGPVPRWQWVELEFDIVVKEQLQRQQRRFSGFPARVVQHEQDHLDGVLFIDYSKEYDLPIYTANARTEEMTAIPRDIFATLHASTLTPQP